MSLTVVLQGVDRLSMSDHVYLAVARPRGRPDRRAWVYRRDVKVLCRRLGLAKPGDPEGPEEMAAALVDAEPKRFPPEPLFTAGSRLLTRAILRKDSLEDRGRRPDPVTSGLARLPRRLGYNLGP